MPQGTAFPDFERFCSGGFLPGTPIEVCCVYQFRHVRMRADLRAATPQTLTDFTPAGALHLTFESSSART